MFAAEDKSSLYSLRRLFMLWCKMKFSSVKEKYLSFVPFTGRLALDVSWKVNFLCEMATSCPTLVDVLVTLDSLLRFISYGERYFPPGIVNPRFRSFTIRGPKFLSRRRLQEEDVYKDGASPKKLSLTVISPLMQGVCLHYLENFELSCDVIKYCISLQPAGLIGRVSRGSATDSVYDIISDLLSITEFKCFSVITGGEKMLYDVQDGTLSIMRQTRVRLPSYARGFPCCGKRIYLLTCIRIFAAFLPSGGGFAVFRPVIQHSISKRVTFFPVGGDLSSFEPGDFLVHWSQVSHIWG